MKGATINYTVYSSAEDKDYVYFEIDHIATLPWWLGFKEVEFRTLHRIKKDKIEYCKRRI